MAKITKEKAIDELKALVSKRRLIVLAGAGVSVESNLPTWEKLLEGLIVMCRTLHVKEPLRREFNALLDDAEKHLARDPVRVASVLKGRLKQIITGNAVATSKYKSWLVAAFDGKQPNNKHKLIVQTDYPFILTTNYDLLFEEAAYASGFSDLAESSFTFKRGAALAGAIVERTPSIVHIHGVVDTLESGEVIFTQEDYRNMIKMKYEGFSFALRMLFFDYSVLYVGYGASDPHLEDISQDLRAYFPNELSNSGYNKSYLLLKREKIDHVLIEYKEDLRTNLIPIDDYSEIDEILETLRAAAPRSNKQKGLPPIDPQPNLPGI